MAVQARRFDARTSPGPALAGRIARVANVLLGVWLFISGTLWAQPQAARLDSYILGAAIALVAIVSTWFERFRFVNAALAVWLATATGLVFELSGAAAYNGFLVAMAVFYFSLISNRGETPLAP
jgi:hypothetical protein